MLSAPGCSSEILFRRCLRRSWLLVAQTVKNLLVMQETRVQSQGQEDHLVRAWQSTPVFLLGESHGQKSREVPSPWGPTESETNGRLPLSLFIFHFSEDLGRAGDTSSKGLSALMRLLHWHFLLFFLMHLVSHFCSLR